MSKVCKQCGILHENRATKCAVCGTAFNDKHIYAKRRRIIILSVLAALLLAAAISYAAYSVTPEAAVRRIMYACRKADVDTVISYYPDFYIESDKIDKKKLLMNTDLRVKKFSEDLYSYYLEDPETPHEKECEALILNFEDFGGENFDRSKLGEIKMVWVNYRLDVYYFWPKRSTRFIVFEYDGRWCWWPYNINR